MCEVGLRGTYTSISPSPARPPRLALPTFLRSFVPLFFPLHRCLSYCKKVIRMQQKNVRGRSLCEASYVELYIILCVDLQHTPIDRDSQEWE